MKTLFAIILQLLFSMVLITPIYISMIISSAVKGWGWPMLTWVIISWLICSTIVVVNIAKWVNGIIDSKEA